MMNNTQIENRRLALKLASSVAVTEVVGATVDRANRYVEFLESDTNVAKHRVEAVETIVDRMIRELTESTAHRSIGLDDLHTLALRLKSELTAKVK